MGLRARTASHTKNHRAQNLTNATAKESRPGENGARADSGDWSRGARAKIVTRRGVGQGGGCGARLLLVAVHLLEPQTMLRWPWARAGHPTQPRPSRVLSFLGCSFSPSSQSPFLLLSQDAAHYQVLQEDVPDSCAYGKDRLSLLLEQPGLNSIQDRVEQNSCLLACSCVRSPKGPQRPAT